MNRLLTFLLLLFPQVENPVVTRLEKLDGFRLAGFTISEAYVLNAREKFVIASQKTAANTDPEGLQLLYLKDNKIVFKSEHVGESYIYRPTFYKFKDSMLIICETGFEYSTGINVFEYKDGSILKMGNIDIASDNDTDTSIIPNMVIAKTHQYMFAFQGPIVLNPGGPREKKFEGRQVKAIYYRNQGELGLLIGN